MNLRGTLLTSAVLVASLAARPAAAEPSKPELDALRAQVQQLISKVEETERSDQAQIADLKAQVGALQAKLAKVSAATAPPPATIAAATPDDGGGAAPKIVLSPARRFTLESGDGQYAIGLVGLVQFDAGTYDFRPASALSGPQALSNGINARRARIGVTGRVAGSWNYTFIYDAGNSSDQNAKGIETAQVVYSPTRGLAFEIGYSNTLFTLDQATSSADTLFLERASPSNVATNINTGDARANAGVRYFNDRYWLGAYLTGPAVGDSHTQVAERFGAFERAAIQALSGPDYSLHLGVGLDELFQASNGGAGTPTTLALSDQPELRIDPTNLLNTGALGTEANPLRRAYVLDLETAATYRSLFWQGEYYHYRIERRGLPDNDFDGGYGEVSWALTGEGHRYNPQTASYQRITPARPFSLQGGGWGAWELAARVSYVGLDSRFHDGDARAGDPAAVNGGRQWGYALGLNWYPNDLIRVLLDYNHVDYKKANGVASKGLPLGAPVGANLDAFALRFQVAY